MEIEEIYLHSLLDQNNRIIARKDIMDKRELTGKERRLLQDIKLLLDLSESIEVYADRAAGKSEKKRKLLETQMGIHSWAYDKIIDLRNVLLEDWDE